VQVRTRRDGPRQDGEYAEFFDVAGTDARWIAEGAEAFETLGARVVEEWDRGGLVEFVVEGGCPAMALAERGALPREVRSADGSGRITAEIPPPYDPVEVVDSFFDAVPEADLAAKRRVDPLTPLFSDAPSGRRCTRTSRTGNARCSGRRWRRATTSGPARDGVSRPGATTRSSASVSSVSYSGSGSSGSRPVSAATASTIAERGVRSPSSYRRVVVSSAVGWSVWCMLRELPRYRHQHGQPQKPGPYSSRVCRRRRRSAGGLSSAVPTAGR
jgi:hypothetical protein